MAIIDGAKRKSFKHVVKQALSPSKPKSLVEIVEQAVSTDTNTKEQKKFTKTIERALSSPDADKAFTSFIDDLASPKKKILPVSIGALLKGAKFALTNPVNSYNLVKLAGSSDIYLDSEFQKSVLEKSEIWDFLKKHVDELPKIGQILAKAGFKEFQEGAFLDQKGLTTLKECFKNDDVLKSLQEIAVEIKQEVPDYNKVTSKTLEMLSTDKNFLKFFNEKGEDIANYIRTGATEILPSDYIKAFDDILQKPQSTDIYAKVIKTFNEHPNFKQELAENINNPNALKIFNKLSPERQIIIEGFLIETKEQAKPFLKESFEIYKINPKIVDIIPTLLNKIPETKEIFDTLNTPNQGVMVALEKSLAMVAGDDKLKSFFADNKTVLPNIASAIIENTPNIQSMTKEYNFDKQMLKIVGEVTSKPETAHDIIADVNKGDYISVTSRVITALNDPSFKLKDILVEQSKEGLFDNLITGVLEQDEKNSQTIKQQLENYGLEAKDVTKITSVMPTLINNPESLQKVFDGFVKGEYTGMAKELITLTKDNPKIKEYLNDNREIFASILDKTLKDVPGINKLDKKELYNITTSMLNQPDTLVQILENVENKKYINVASSIVNLTWKEGQTLNVIRQIPNVVKAGVGYFNRKSDKTSELEDKVPLSVLKEAQNIVSNLNSKINIVGSNANSSSITPISNNKKKEEIHR